MSKPSDGPAGRTVVASISLSLDGRVNGPGGDYDMSWIVRHALTDVAREHMVKVTSTATTALLGRKNYQGITLCPALAGGGTRLFGDDLPGSDWSLAAATPTGSGAICLLYDRIRSA